MRLIPSSPAARKHIYWPSSFSTHRVTRAHSDVLTHSTLWHGFASRVRIRCWTQSVSLCLNTQKSLLDTVSTTCGSGWVNCPKFKIKEISCLSSTHPLPQVVLTVSKTGAEHFGKESTKENE